MKIDYSNLFSNLIAGLSFIISLIALYFTSLKRAKLVFYTDEKISINKPQGGLTLPHTFELNLTIFNKGSKPGIVSDMVLILDKKHYLVPLSRNNGFEPIIINGYASVFYTVKFVFPYQKFDKEVDGIQWHDLYKGEHAYSLKVRIQNKDEWKDGLSRSFDSEASLTTKFKEQRLKILNKKE